MDNAAFAGVVVSYSVIFVGEVFAAAISGGSNGRLALAAGYDFDTAMVNRHALRSFLRALPAVFICAERHKTPSARPHIPQSCGI